MAAPSKSRASSLSASSLSCFATSSGARRSIRCLLEHRVGVLALRVMNVQSTKMIQKDQLSGWYFRYDYRRLRCYNELNPGNVWGSCLIKCLCHPGCRCCSISSMRTSARPARGSSGPSVPYWSARRRAISPIIAIELRSPSLNASNGSTIPPFFRVSTGVELKHRKELSPYAQVRIVGKECCDCATDDGQLWLSRKFTMSDALVFEVFHFAEPLKQLAVSRGRVVPVARRIGSRPRARGR